MPNLRYCLDYSKRKGKRSNNNSLEREYVSVTVFCTPKTCTYFGLCVNCTETISYKIDNDTKYNIRANGRKKTSLTAPHWLKCQPECIREKNITLNLCLLNDMDHEQSYSWFWMHMNWKSDPRTFWRIWTVSVQIRKATDQKSKSETIS